KKRKRSKHEDEPFVKDGKLTRKGRTITYQSCRNTGHNKATYKGQGRKATTGGNNVEASGSASRQAQQTEHAVGQDGSIESGVDSVIGLSTAIGEGGLSGVVSDNGNFPMVDEEEVTSKKLPPMAKEMIMLIEVLKRNFILPSDSHPPVIITKNMSAVIDNWFGGGGYLRDYVRVVDGTDDRGKLKIIIGLGGGGYLRNYVRVVDGMDDE
nr:hypothetical protein [Tanacetum cinerariifolium]